MRGVVIALVSVAVFACGSQAPWPLEVGVHQPIGPHKNFNDRFVPLVENDMVKVVTGPNGLDMVVLSLRAEGADPRTPSPTITITVDGILMAADLAGEPTDMVPDVVDGLGYVLPNLNVPFQTKLCCFNCSLGHIEAKLEDRSGQLFAGKLTVQLSRSGTCPDPAVCCADANDCPDPSFTQVCQ